MCSTRTKNINSPSWVYNSGALGYPTVSLIAIPACPVNAAPGDVAFFSINPTAFYDYYVKRHRLCKMWAVGPSSPSPN